MQLLEDRVLVKPKPQSDISEGGIIIPDSAKKRASEGTVVLVGTGFTVREGERAGFKLPMAVKPGDKVLYDAEAGSDMNYEKEIHVLMLEGSIMAIV